MAKWRSLSEVIAKDLDRLDEIPLVRAARFGEKGIKSGGGNPAKISPKRDRITGILVEKMIAGKVYKCKDLYDMVGEVFHVAENLGHHDYLFEKVDRGKWRMK